MWDQWREQLSSLIQTAAAPMETMFPCMSPFCPCVTGIIAECIILFVCVFFLKHLIFHLTVQLHAICVVSVVFVLRCRLYCPLLSYTLFLLAHHMGCLSGAPGP